MTETDIDDAWETESDTLQDAVARSIADAVEWWERYHTDTTHLDFEAWYFLDRLAKRGYLVVHRPVKPT
jgi:hypothetical protein